MTFKHIKYSEKIRRAKEELYSTDPDQIIKWWWSEWDDYLWWIYGWKIYVVWAETWVWKSTFINQICSNVSNQGWRVVKYSLEDRMEDIWKEELYYQVNRLRYIDKKPAYDWIKFLNWIYLRDDYRDFQYYVDMADDILSKKQIVELDKEKQVNINDLCALMVEECEKWANMFAIDHLHYFEKIWWERHDLEIESVMQKINEIVRKYNVAVFIVAHYRKLNKTRPDNDSFKDASWIKQVANVIIHIIRDMDDNETEFVLWKLRWPIKPYSLTATFDLSKFEYSFHKTEQQKESDEFFN